MYLATIVLAGIFAGNTNYALLFLGADYTPLVLSGEIWRLVISAFLHGSMLHLLLNMYAFYIVGNFIERFYGRRKLLTIYIITAIFGSLATLIGDVAEFWSGGGIGVINTLSVGASGSIFGMVGVLLGSRVKKNVYEPQLGIDTQQLVSVVIYNLIIGVAINLIGGGIYINIWAHFGGLIAGFFLGLILSGINAFYIPRWRRITANVLFAFSALSLIGSFIALIGFIIFNFL